MRVGVSAAKTHLSRLINRARAGGEVVITRRGTPVAKLVAAEAALEPRMLGLLKGRVRIADDFDAPLPDEVGDAFEGRG